MWVCIQQSKTEFAFDFFIASNARVLTNLSPLFISYAVRTLSTPTNILYIRTISIFQPHVERLTAEHLPSRALWRIQWIFQNISSSWAKKYFGHCSKLEFPTARRAVTPESTPSRTLWKSKLISKNISSRWAKKYFADLSELEFPTARRNLTAESTPSRTLWKSKLISKNISSRWAKLYFSY